MGARPEGPTDQRPTSFRSDIFQRPSEPLSSGRSDRPWAKVSWATTYMLLFSPACLAVALFGQSLLPLSHTLASKQAHVLASREKSLRGQLASRSFSENMTNSGHDRRSVASVLRALRSVRASGTLWLPPELPTKQAESILTIEKAAFSETA